MDVLTDIRHGNIVNSRDKGFLSIIWGIIDPYVFKCWYVLIGGIIAW